ncbi:MAG: low-specificity L-threonine aldolase [Clostridia bacterium]|nr:low-specificity L-threonine aldolase [Clostridia bacterium]
MIDLRSDTVTQPTEKMREVMFNAVVGDDVYDDDPTIKALERLACEILGKEAALFVPSGTFGNQLCIMTHTRPGDEIIVSYDAHILYHEVGAAAKLSGVQIRGLNCFGGRYNLEELKSAIREEDIHYPTTGLICVENAHGNGSVIPLEHMKKIYQIANENNVPVHLDGARLFNAATALEVTPKELADQCDSLTFCLSKGLCAPVGSIVAGNQSFIARAKKNRKLMGGGLRQAGFLAAAGIEALTHMTKRLEEDHELAKYLADELEGFKGIEVIRERLDINMVFFKMDKSLIEEQSFIEAMLKHDIKINGTEDGEWRFVTSHDVSKADIDKVITIMKGILKA